MQLGELEELMLLAINQQGDNAYGVTIQDALEKVGRKISSGAIYVTLDRLEEKGLVESWRGEATAERGENQNDFSAYLVKAKKPSPKVQRGAMPSVYQDA